MSTVPISDPDPHPAWCRQAPLCSADAGRLHVSSPVTFHGTGEVCLDPVLTYEPGGPWADERWVIDLQLAQPQGGAVQVRASLSFLPNVGEEEQLPDDEWAARVSDRALFLPLDLAGEVGRALAFLVERAGSQR